MSLLTSLISYWKLDEASGNALDANGSNTLTPTFFAPAATTGVINNGRVYVTANNEDLTHVSNSDFQIATSAVSYSFSCWLQITAAGTQDIIIKRTGTGIGSSLEYMMRTDTSTPTVYWGIGASFGSLSSGTSMSANTWYFIVWGYDASTNKFFICVNDGAVQLSAVVTTQQLAGTNPFALGSANGSEKLDGKMDEIGFWKKLLSASEITQLYNGGSGYPYSSFGGVTYPILIPSPLSGLGGGGKLFTNRLG